MQNIVNSVNPIIILMNLKKIFEPNIRKKLSYFERFWKGVGCSGFFYDPPEYKTLSEKDIERMMKNNWKTVGKNLKYAVNQFKKRR